MERVSGTLGPRRRIATTLKRLREESNQNLADVARELMISTSKLSRLENAQGKPRPRDIRDLIRHYGIEDTQEAARLKRWVTSAQTPGWWTDFDDDVLEQLDAHLAYEADATVARVYTLPFLPALLQTDEYAEAVYRDMEQRSADKIPQLMEIRKTRREALVSREGLGPLRLEAVTHESTLHQMVGSPEILRDQLDALLDRLDPPGGQRPENIRLYVLPFTALPVRTMTCMYAYFEYLDPEDLEQDVVNIETHAGWWSIEDPEQVRQYRNWHDALVSTALNQDDSLDLIRSVRNSK
ncbi:MAG: transcriptional regulator [Actinomycetia bacterium]|nr:transcriptional regulator [Actinomycetes bacterium]